MIRVLFGDRGAWPEYEPLLAEALTEAGLDAEVGTDWPAETVDYIVTSPDGWISDFAPFRRAKAVLNLWAGVEGIVGNATLVQPLVRMVEPGLREGMVEWVAGHVLRHHLGMDRYVKRTAPHWDYAVPPLARDRTVAILGLGELGAVCATALVGLGFGVLGWSRSPKTVAGVATESGAEGLERVLSRAEILVLLLPATAATERLLDKERLARMPEGAVVINPGRGPLIDDVALVEALAAGRIGHATLDVFREEPLPAGHPFWNNPRVTVTPHVASATRATTASRSIAENIRRGETGEPFVGLVDRAAGY